MKKLKSARVEVKLNAFMYYLLRKVLRVPRNNPVVWQHSLLEVKSMKFIRKKYRNSNQRRRPTVRDYLKRSSKRHRQEDDNNKIAKKKTNRRRYLSRNLDNLTNEEKELTYCKSGCGKQT